MVTVNQHQEVFISTQQNPTSSIPSWREKPHALDTKLELFPHHALVTVRLVLWWYGGAMKRQERGALTAFTRSYWLNG